MNEMADILVRSEALKADAERLAELKREELLASGKRLRAVESLIAVYEECAARGIAFGGGR